MANVVNEYQYKNIEKSNKLVVHCESKNTFLEPISLNKLISIELQKIRTNDRKSLKMKRIFIDILTTFPDDVFIADIDVMFNPSYKIDVLSILIEARREKAFEVIWPGKFKEGKLIYSEEEYLDYKVFDLSNYDLVCVI